ncbi:hypothetical protein NL676_002705 [Syzygium grande]|nr:hypothetical protein NL676_002705 [Syzygium grande]
MGYWIASSGDDSDLSSEYVSPMESPSASATPQSPAAPATPPRPPMSIFRRCTVRVFRIPPGEFEHFFADAESECARHSTDSRHSCHPRCCRRRYWGGDPCCGHRCWGHDRD